MRETSGARPNELHPRQGKRVAKQLYWNSKFDSRRSAWTSKNIRTLTPIERARRNVHHVASFFFSFLFPFRTYYHAAGVFARFGEYTHQRKNYSRLVEARITGA